MYRKYLLLNRIFRCFFAYIVFVCIFSSQSIKINSLTPVQENEEIENTEPRQSTSSVSDIKEVNNSDVSNPKEFATQKNDDVKKSKMSLKDYQPLKEGSLSVQKQIQQVQQNNKTVGNSTATQKNNSESDKSLPSGKQESSKSYAKQKNVHLKNYNPDEEKAYTDWKLKSLSHFKLYYEKGTENILNSVASHLEATFTNMRLKVAVFPNWIGNEPAKIYLYASKESYLKGEFKPVEWSEGSAFPNKKIVAVFAKPDLQSLKSKISHELSHVYLRSFFSEKNAEPPLWADEGLAVYMESLVYNGNSPWDLAIKSYPDIKTFPFPQYFKSDLTGMSDENVSYWYLQAFGIVSFLMENGSNIHIKNFYTRLRAGENETALLWNIYRYKNIADFQRKMNDWMAMKSGNSRQQDDIFSDFSVGRSLSGNNRMEHNFGLKKKEFGLKNQ